MTRKTLLFTAAVLALGATVVLAASGGARARPDAKPISLPVPSAAPAPVAWIDVHAPRRVLAAVGRNAWLSRAAAAPLGEGFMGGWSPFLAARGPDLKARFTTSVGRLVAEEVLSEPFRVVWFAGSASGGRPALVVPRASSRGRAALDALLAATHRGTYTFSRCPGPAPTPPATTSHPPAIAVARLLVAEHALYTAERAGRVVLAATPQAALQGLCVDAPPAEPAAGVDVDVTFARDAAGRDAQGLFALAGLRGPPRLSLAVQGEALVPVGIGADLAATDRLASEAVPEAMLRAIPEDIGVVLTLALSLPEELTPAALQAHLAGNAKPRAVRQAVVLWNPRGDRAAEGEVALLWSHPADERALRALFSGGEVRARTVCGLPAISSSPELLERMARACEARAPNMLASPAPVLAGLRAPASIGLGVNVGRVLSRLVDDAWRADPERPGGAAALDAPLEIDDARRLLEELPFMGFSGTARDRALVPGGYRS